MATSELQSRLELAHTIALEAGQITLRWFRSQELDLQFKSDASPVTIADRTAEEHLRARIAATFPDDAILGEEFGEQSGTSGYRWILDPIDGTKSFVAGVPLYGTLVGVEHGGRSVVGVIHIPALGETVYAARGHGAWYTQGNQPVREARVSGKTSLTQSVFLTSEVKNYNAIERMEAYTALQNASWVSRTWGDCYGYLLVATGRAEVMVDPLMHIWDCAALQPVLEEAGGTFTDWAGNATIHATSTVATNGLVLDQVLALLKNH